ncbi:hypothetical protein [Sinorhizobium fredii]|uniref:hypothetical protein n=1 Tax=Rhizobium fredii TaxID=380 RepID=UPI003512A902
MRRPHRNIEIFSMSVLDLFASALGGFIMIAIILFPSYMADKKLTAKLEQAKEKIDEQQEEIKTSKNALAEAAVLKSDLEKKVDALRLEIARTFLIISIEWDTPGVDVDLGIRDPDDHYYYFARTNKNGKDFNAAQEVESATTNVSAVTDLADVEEPSAAGDVAVETKSWAELSFDNRTGPGLELWQAPLAKPGIYQVSYKMYNAAGNSEEQSIPVRGKVFYRNGREELPVHDLSNSNREVTISIEVTEEGTIQIF